MKSLKIMTFLFVFSILSTRAEAVVGPSFPWPLNRVFIAFFDISQWVDESLTQLKALFETDQGLDEDVIEHRRVATSPGGGEEDPYLE